MEIRHLRTFLVVARELHFGRAATVLNTAQPAVSRTIASLEEELGIELFARNRRKVELTACGVALLRRTECLLGDLERAIGEAQRLARGELGEVRIAFAGTASMNALPEALARLRRQHPLVRVHVQQIATLHQVDALRRERIDLALTPTPIDVEDLRHLRILSEPLIAILPEGHRLAERESVSHLELASEPTVVLSRSGEPVIARSYDESCEAAGVPATIAAEVDSLDAQLALVASGLGISHAPATVARVQFPGVVYRKIEPTIETRICAVWNPDALSAAADRLLDILRTMANERRAA